MLRAPGTCAVGVVVVAVLVAGEVCDAVPNTLHSSESNAASHLEAFHSLYHLSGGGSPSWRPHESELSQHLALISYAG